MVRESDRNILQRNAARIDGDIHVAPRSVRGFGVTGRIRLHSVPHETNVPKAPGPLDEGSEDRIEINIVAAERLADVALLLCFRVISKAPLACGFGGVVGAGVAPSRLHFQSVQERLRGPVSLRPIHATPRLSGIHLLDHASPKSGHRLIGDAIIARATARQLAVSGREAGIAVIGVIVVVVVVVVVIVVDQAARAAGLENAAQGLQVGSQPGKPLR